MDCIPDLTASLPIVALPRGHVEICVSQRSLASASVVIDAVRQHLSSYEDMYHGSQISEFRGNKFLEENVTNVTVNNQCIGDNSNSQKIDFQKGSIEYHVFQLSEDGPGMEEIDNEGDIPAAKHWILPAAEFHGTWDSLIYDSDVKDLLLNYAYTTLLFSDKNIDPNLISWNRVILLHGPPGTGKTSLCKALAQKLTIRLDKRFRYGQLLEINSHSLFSKWFSESGKLVLKMFQRIQDLIDDRDSIVFILIDEVESLTAARTSAMKGTEPSDSIRVVNALLTQIDQIKRNPNVIILTTSNVTGAIDLAFVDRADIKQYIGPPSVKAIYRILQTCIKELIEKEIISPQQTILDFRSLEVLRFHKNEATKLSLELLKIAREIEGFSGRDLRKLPFLAHALFIQAPSVTLEQYLDGLSRAGRKLMADKDILLQNSLVNEQARKRMVNGDF